MYKSAAFELTVTPSIAIADRRSSHFLESANLLTWRTEGLNCAACQRVRPGRERTSPTRYEKFRARNHRRIVPPSPFLRLDLNRTATPLSQIELLEQLPRMVGLSDRLRMQSNNPYRLISRTCSLRQCV